LDFWTLDEGEPADHEFHDRGRRVRVHFETPRDGRWSVNPPLLSEDFPLPQTRWTRYYLQADGALAQKVPATAGRDSGDSYAVTPVPTESDFNGVRYLLAPQEPLAICGPVAVTLWARCSTIETDFFVALVDVDPDGVVQLLQRGLLRSSHRQLDPHRSMSVDVDGEKLLVRPRHRHRDRQPLVPHQPHRFDIEIFPVGHVVRPGHRLGLWIGQPPRLDPVTRSGSGEPSYSYVSAPPRSKVTILRSASYPSHVLLPVLPELPPLAAEPPVPGEQAGVFVY
jgi:predicted acyl esterase